MEKILKRYPDYAKATPEYIAGIAEILSTFEPQMQARLADIAVGVSARCRYLPTVADIADIANEFSAANSAPLHGGYKRLESENWAPTKSSAERAAHVKRILGYNPADRGLRPLVDVPRDLPVTASDRPEFRPFPKLWEAFADEPELLRHRQFGTYFDASKALAVYGREAARAILA